jgi:rod shape-determining protein MreD
MPGPWMRIPTLVFATLVVHEALLRGLRLDGVRPDLMLGLTVVAGAVAGSERGAVMGFLAGLVVDLFLPTPLGLSALVYCVLGYLVGTLEATTLSHGRASLPLVTLVASVAGVVLFALVGSVLGQPGMVRPDLLKIAAVVALVNSLVSLPTARAVRWSMSGSRPEPGFGS